MSRLRAAGVFFALSFAALPAGAVVPAAPLSGVVRHLQAPIPGALVFAYGVSNASLLRITTGYDGSFAFHGLAAGVYDVVAYKRGFYPSLIRLWHEGGVDHSLLAIDLLPAPRGAEPATIWSWRDRLPSDILREITLQGGLPGQSLAGSPAAGVRVGSVETGSLTTEAGSGAGSSSSSATLALAGALTNSLQYSFRGTYASASGTSQTTPLANGEDRNATLVLASSPQSAVAFHYASRLFNSGDGAASDESESLEWSRDNDSAGHVEATVARILDSGVAQASSVRPDLFAPRSLVYEARAHWSRQTQDGSYAASLRASQREFQAPPGSGDSATAATFDDAVLQAGAQHTVAGILSAGVNVTALAGSSGTRVSPGALVRVEIFPGAALTVSGSRQAVTNSAAANLPPLLLAAGDEEPYFSSHASASLEFGTSDANKLVIVASSGSVSAPLRVYFDGDRLQDFGSLYLFDGSHLEKLSAAASARIFNILEGALKAESGRISGRLSPETNDFLGVTGANGIFYGGEASLLIRPTGTDFTCSLRRIRQVLQSNDAPTINDSDKTLFAVGQDLTILGFDPFGKVWRLVVSYETNSTPVAAGSIEQSVQLQTRRLTGGFTVSF